MFQDAFASSGNWNKDFSKTHPEFQRVSFTQQKIKKKRRKQRAQPERLPDEEFKRMSDDNHDFVMALLRMLFFLLGKRGFNFFKHCKSSINGEAALLDYYFYLLSVICCWII